MATKSKRQEYVRDEYVRDDGVTLNFEPMDNPFELTRATLAVANELMSKQKTWYPHQTFTCRHQDTRDSLYGEFVVVVTEKQNPSDPRPVVWASRTISGQEMFKLAMRDIDGFISRIDEAIMACSRELLQRWHAELP